MTLLTSRSSPMAPSDQGVSLWKRGRGAWWVVWNGLRLFPWRITAQTLRERFREDRLGVTAGSLTLTTVISLVPLLTVGLAVFSVFPMFGRMQAGLQRWLVDSLIPDAIARPVLTYLNQFAGKAAQLGWSGAVLLLVTSLALILTIDRKLNDIWRVRQPRPLTQRVLVYWAVLTLGPLLLGASVSTTSYAISANRGLVAALPGGVKMLLDALEFAMVAAGLTLLFRHVPNARVRSSHALVGGLLGASGIELAKQMLGWYVAKVPTYSAVYGAFATVPILLIWLYLLWVVVLLSAVVVAYLPSLLAGVHRRGGAPGWSFQLALEVVAALWKTSRDTTQPGLSLESLSRRLRVDDLQLEEPLEALQTLDWVGRLDEAEARYVLLADPLRQPLAPLVQALLLPKNELSMRMWQANRWDSVPLAEALPSAPSADPTPHDPGSSPPH